MLVPSLFNQLTGLSSFAQIIVILPLALDLLGPPSFLICSLLLTLHQLVYSTLRLACKNTPLAPLVLLLNLCSPFVPATCALLTIYFYLNPSSTSSSSGILSAAHSLLSNTLPTYYAAALRFVSPIFTVLEGFATLLCAQLLGRMSKGFVDSMDDKEDGIEWRRLGLLVVAAGLYCAGFAWLILAYPLTSPESSQLHPILLGASLTTVFFLTLIGFARRRATVIETALVFLYVVYGAWIGGRESGMEPRDFGTGWLTTGWGVSKPLPFNTTTTVLQPTALLNPIVGVLKYFTIVLTSTLGIDVDQLLGKIGVERLGLGLDGKAVDGVTGLAIEIASRSTASIRKIALSLPPTLLISLCFRLLVLHLASRIIPAIRRASAGWDGGETDGEGVTGSEGREGFWDGRRLGEEAPSVRATTILLSYRRAILITVYTHLLLLDNGSQVWWRWVNIILFMGVWALELLFEDDFDDDAESLKGWTVD